MRRIPSLSAAVVLWALAGSALAATTVNAVSYATADSSCLALKNTGAGLAAASRLTVLSCSDDPVIVGSTILSRLGTSLTVLAYPVTVQTSAAPLSAAPVTSLPPFQAASTLWTKAQTDYAVASAPAGTASSITVTDSFGTATPDQYQAMALVFAAILAAAAIIWGVKQVLRVLRNPSEY